MGHLTHGFSLTLLSAPYGAEERKEWGAMESGGGGGVVGGGGKKKPIQDKGLTLGRN